MQHPAIHVSPNNALIDTPLNIQITGVHSFDIVTLKAEMQDNYGTNWESYAKLQPDSEGEIDLSTAKPLSGTYATADVTGMFWSMNPVAHNNQPAKDPLDPLITKLTLIGGEKILDIFNLTRHFVTPNVEGLAVRERSLVGTLFYHSQEKAFPTIIVLGGSDGGLREENAALFASHGFNTLALAYFGIENLPKELINIPLEYIEKAIDWLSNQPNVDPEKIGMMGTSKGGEPALLCASMFPSIRAVTGYVPSSVIYPGISPEGAGSSSWNYNGNELSYAWGSIPDDVGAALGYAMQSGDPIAFRDWYFYLAEDETKAEISVENINGPVLLISGGDDQMWPADILSDRVVKRLKNNEHPFSYEHITYPNAGHSFTIPGMPTTQSTEITFPSGMRMLLGGSAKENANAQADAWHKIKRFYNKHFKN